MIPASPRRLGALLLSDDDVPLPPDPGGSADHLDVHDAALLEPDAPAELARLRTRGFVAGAVRSWAGVDGSVVQVTLHRFASADGALHSLEDLRSALTAAAATERTFAGGVVMSIAPAPDGDPADVPGSSHVAHVGLATTGDVVVMAVTTGPVGGLVDVDGGLARALADRQRQRLEDA
jgi:hypothetical protein